MTAGTCDCLDSCACHVRHSAPIAPHFTIVNVSKRSVNVTWWPAVTGNPGYQFTVEYKKIGRNLFDSTFSYDDDKFEQ